MATDHLGLDITEMGITVENEHLQHISTSYIKYTPEAMALVSELTANITDILANSIASAFTALKTSIHERPIYVLFEPQLGCDPLTDHQTPKDIYPIFSEAIASAEKQLGEMSASLIADALREKVSAALSLEVSKTSALKAKAEDALGELAALRAKIVMKDKFIQQLTQSKAEEHGKLISEMTVLREQAFMKRRFGDRYKPDNVDKVMDDAQQAGLVGSLLGSTGEFAANQGSQANKMIRDQLAAVMAENKELKLKVEAAGLAQKQIEELESNFAVLKFNMENLEASHMEAIAKLESDLKEKTILISTYQDNERALNSSVQELTRQLKSAEKRRPTSSDITSRTDTDLFRENSELKSKIFELQEQLMENQMEQKQKLTNDNRTTDEFLTLQRELQEKTAEADTYRQKLEEAGILNAPVDAFIKLAEHNSTVASLKSQLDELETQNRELTELTDKLQHQIDHLIENEAAEINSVLEANEILHKQKLKNAVEAAVCIDSFNESIQAAKRAITNFDDFGCQVPDKRARKSTMLSGEGDEIEGHEEDHGKDDAEASRIRRAIDAARKIYSNRLPTVNNTTLSYDVSSVDEVFKQLFDTAKTAKTQLMKKHQETLKSEAQTLMRNLNLHDRIARAISSYTNFVDQPPKEPLKLMSKEQLRDVLCNGVDIDSADESSLEQDGTLIDVSNAPKEEQNEVHELPPAKPDGPAPKGRKRRASPSKHKNSRSTLSTPLSISTRPATRKSGTTLSGTTTSRASELEEVDGERDFFRAGVPSNSAREAIDTRTSTARSVTSDSDHDANQLMYTLTDTGKRAALAKHSRISRSKGNGRKPRLLIKLMKDRLSGEVRDELGRPVSLEHLYMYGYCMDSSGDLVYYGDCSVNKASDDPNTIARKFLAGKDDELVLSNNQSIPRENALRFGYKGPTRNGEYIFIGQPLDLYDQVMRLSPDSVSAMMTKILGHDIDYDDIIAEFNFKLDLDEVTQRPYVYVDTTEATSLQESALDTSHAFTHTRTIEFLNKVDLDSLKVPEEDAFKAGILPDANSVYRYARPVLHLSQVDNLLVADPQGNEITTEDALDAGYVGPFGTQQEYYYFSPIPPGETRTCELVCNGSKLRITTNNDEPNCYEVDVADAYKHGFLPATNGEYHYAGDLPYLREIDTGSNTLYDLLDKPVDRGDAEKHGYLRHTDGKYYYIGAANLPHAPVPPQNVDQPSSIDIYNSSFDDESIDDVIGAKGADITLLYDKNIDLFVEKDTGYVVDNKTMLRDYGYLVDNTNTPRFVGVGNTGTVLPNNTDINTIDQSKTIIAGYDNKIHVYDQTEIDVYYENNVAIVPKKLDIVRLQKRLEAANNPIQLKKMTKHMQKLETKQLTFSQPPIRDTSSCSSDKISILIDDTVAKSTILDIKNDDLRRFISNDSSKTTTIPTTQEDKQEGDEANNPVIEELINVQAPSYDRVSTCESAERVNTSIIHIEPRDLIKRNQIDTLENCTIIDGTSLGTDLDRLSTAHKTATRGNTGQGFSRNPVSYTYSPDRATSKRHGPGLVVTSYGSVDDTFEHTKSPIYQTYMLRPSSKGRIVVQNIIKPSPSINVRPLFDREAGIVFDEQTHAILGQVNETTGDIEDTTGRTIGHTELMSRTIKHSITDVSPKETVRRAPVHHLRSTTIASTSTPLKRSYSHDPRHSMELTQESSAFGGFIEPPIRAISTGTELIMNTPTQLRHADPTLLFSGVKKSFLRRNLIDPKSGRTTQNLDKSDLVLVTLHDPDSSVELDQHSISTSQINMCVEPALRGVSAPARGSSYLSDTRVKEDSVVSMHDGVFPEIDDRSHLGETPSKHVRATSHRAIGCTPTIIPGMHNPAPLQFNTLYAERKTINALSDTLPVIQQQFLDPTVQRSYSKHDISMEPLISHEPNRRAQSIRYTTGHMLPSMRLPHELLRRPYYKDSTSKWVPYTQVTLVPDNSKMLSGTHYTPLSVLQNLTCHVHKADNKSAKSVRPLTTNDISEATSLRDYDVLASDDENLAKPNQGHSEPPRSLPPVRYSNKNAAVKASSSEKIKYIEQLSLGTHGQATITLPRETSNPICNEYGSYNFTPEVNEKPVHSIEDTKFGNVQLDSLSPSNFASESPLVTTSAESEKEPRTVSIKNKYYSNNLHALTKTESHENDGAPDVDLVSSEPKPHRIGMADQHRSLVTSRKRLSVQSKGCSSQHIHQPHIIQIVQAELDAPTSSIAPTSQAFSFPNSTKELEISGLAINTSPHRRYK